MKRILLCIGLLMAMMLPHCHHQKAANTACNTLKCEASASAQEAESLRVLLLQRIEGFESQLQSVDAGRRAKHELRPVPVKASDPVGVLDFQ